MKMHKLNPSEKALRNKLNEVLFAYQENDWLDLEAKLNQKGSSWNLGKSIKIISGIAVVAIATASYFYFTGTEKSTSQVEELNQEVTIPIEHTNTKEHSSLNTATATEDEITKTEIQTPAKKPAVSVKLAQESSSPKTIQNESIKTENNISDKQTKTTVASPVYGVIDQIQVIGKPCLGETLSINAKAHNLNKEVKFDWKINGQLIANKGEKISLKIEEIGTYKISVSNGNTLKRTEIIVEELPQIDFFYSDGLGAFDDFQVELKANENIENATWNIQGKNQKYTGPIISTEFLNSGVYDVELSSTNSLGCSVSISKPIAINKDFDPLAPEAFTPDGDGTNDTFIPQGFASLDATIQFSVFDNKGHMVYKSNSLLNPWNGGLNNQGNILPEGTYVWNMEVTKDNKTKVFTDLVKIRRF